MKRNTKLDKANSYRLSQEVLRNRALSKGVNLIAPETIFLSPDTSFGKNVTVEPYVVFGPKVKVGDNSYIKSFSHIEGAKIEKNVTISSRLQDDLNFLNDCDDFNFDLLAIMLLQLNSILSGCETNLRDDSSIFNFQGI